MTKALENGKAGLADATQETPSPDTVTGLVAELRAAEPAFRTSWHSRGPGSVAGWDVLLSHYTAMAPEYWVMLALIARAADALEAKDRELVEAQWARSQEVELNAVAAALPGVRFMDPPDGGSPTLGEQVTRMAETLATAEARIAVLEDALRRIAEHPEKYDNGVQSYAVGFAFWNVQKIARTVLPNGEPK